MTNAAPYEEPEIIRNPGQKTGILRRLHESRNLLDVHLPERGTPFRSALLYVDPQSRRLTLDELKPRRGHDRIEIGTELRVVSRTLGVDTRFTVTVQEIGLADGIYYYVAGYPEEIVYNQRRRFVRVPVPLTRQQHCTLSGGEDAPDTDIQLCDLSAGGIGAYVIKGPEPEPHNQYDCHIALHDSQPLDARVEIRYLEYDRQRKRYRFGAEFQDFTHADRDRLQGLVLSLQRELLRKT
ncbi:Flagellar brake protein YcgR [wastewater metagenome]|uniref:Flagellar brake protein YcgR n=2 Tax=unclassified sequences TaxID=12908 RepID=A0A5B8RDP4_9ZZZZ|nr:MULTISPECIES: flagellar brake protein [Arhodomonas]MCS4502822.1 flagellar brake protein [Arhodomonas aquaeolei]QEA07159.1 flagellar brake protein YcgR [uncultured organism]